MDRRAARILFFIGGFLTLLGVLGLVDSGGMTWYFVLPNLIGLTGAYYVLFLRKEGK